jgi:RNA polymerase sigma-70 factor (ECF subfamily)
VDERAAIERLQRGDIEGLATLVTRYQTEATRIAQLITRDRALAEDVVQNAFVRVFDRIAQYDTERPFTPWFFRIVSNDAIKAAQRSARHVSLSDRGLDAFDQLPDDAPGPDELLTTLEQFDSVTAALADLSPEQRAAIVLRYYAGLNDREVAARLGSAPGTVRWRLHAARKRLRQLLHDPEPAPINPHEEHEP